MVIIIAIIACIVYLLFFKKKKTIDSAPIIKIAQPNEINVAGTIEPEKEVEEIEHEIFTDEAGRQYKNVIKTKELPRKTYLHGNLVGKYWGELDHRKEDEYTFEKFYDFNIYEATIEVFEENGVGFVPFDFEPDTTFPKEQLPQTIPCTIYIKGHKQDYAVVLHEPQLKGIYFNRKLHQEDGNEIFGTIQGEITGYILDITIEEYTDKEYIDEPKINEAPDIIKETEIIPTYTPTGNVAFKNNYKRIEYFYSDHKNTYWGNWFYYKPIGASRRETYISSGIGVLGTIFSIIFLLLVLPHLILLIPFLLLPLLFKIIPARIFSFLLNIIGGILLIAFILSIFTQKNRQSYIPNPVVQNQPEERKVEYDPINDTTHGEQKKDTLIKHYRHWQDYTGNDYEGAFWVKRSAYSNATHYKNDLNITQATESNYDKIVYSLKEHDKNNLNGVYQLFDSLKTINNLSTTGFAEMVVSFIQDMPYTVVLPEGCDPNLYSDNFIRNYLSSSNAQCDGFEKFGINTPVEFMATLKGDCDTRTLLLYTIFAHYGYDVALMSSEFYNHSLLGINLPYAGKAYILGNQRYVLWETTAPNIKPGILPNEISNLDYWRISLKSK